MTTATPPDLRFETLVGRTPEGHRVYINVQVESHTARPGQLTIDHEPTDTITRISITGTVLGRFNRWESGGQCRSALDGLAPADGWSAFDVEVLAAAWDRWHLNDLKGGCVHVPDPVWEHVGYRRPDLENTPACPETGYRWGHAWLYAPPTDDVLTALTDLSTRPRVACPEIRN